MTLTFDYNEPALAAAVKRDRGATLRAAFPDQFSFSLTDRPVEATQYITHLKDVLNTISDRASEPSEAKSWSSRSTIEIRVNGLDQPCYVYSVIKKGVIEYAPHRGAYDAPEIEYTYTRFDCTLVELR